MTRAPFSFWAAWAVFVASLGLWLALPGMVPPLREPWNAAEAAVAGFVLAIFALVGAIGSFALREWLVFGDVRSGRGDLRTEAGVARVRVRLVALWALCSAIGGLGAILIHGSGRPAAGLPYLVGAAALLVLHAPTAGFFRRACACAAAQAESD